jgi:enoyl-CoA hydratase
MPAMPETIAVETTDHIATVSLQHKTMTPTFFREVEEVFTGFARETDLRAVVVRAAGDHFTYGLDLKASFAAHGNLMTGASMAGPRMELRQLILDLQKSFNAIADCPVPVIAAVHGWVIGGGIDLISACDIRLASADAKLSVRETRIAIVADLGTLQRLPAIIGKGHTRELAFTGKDITAERAAEIGLVNHVYADRDALDQAAQDMAREIAANAPLTVRGVKQVLDYCEDKSVAEGLRYVATWNSAFLASEDLGEAAAAFMQKREPKFKGR